MSGNGNTIHCHFWRDIASVVVLAVVAFGLVQWVYALPRSALLSADTSASIVPRAGFYGSEQFPNSARRYRWSKYQGMMHVPNPGGQLDVWMILAGGPDRSVPVTLRTDTNFVTTFMVAPEPRIYRFLPGFSPHERVGVWLDAPTMKDRQKRKLGVVVSDVFIVGRGDPPQLVLFAAVLIPLALYGTLRQFAVRHINALSSALAFLGALILVQHMWGWHYAVARPILVYALLLYAVVLVGKMRLLHSSNNVDARTGSQEQRPGKGRNSFDNSLPEQGIVRHPVEYVNREEHTERTEQAWVFVKRVLAVIVFALVPVGVTTIFLFDSYGKTLADFGPFYSDEIFYWHQTWTFSTVGFGGGYYTLNEYPARLDTFRFYVHGPMFPMLHGSIGALVGWASATGVLINSVLLTAATGFFAVVSGLRGKRMIFTAVFLITLSSFMMHIPSNMQESVHHAIAIVLAGLFYRLMSAEHMLPWWAMVAFFGFIVLVSLLRITWSLLLIPFALLSFRQLTVRKALVSLVLVSGVMGVLFLITSSWASFYPNVMAGCMQELAAGEYGTAFWLLVENVRYNFGFVHKGSLLEIAQRYEVLLLFAATAATDVLILVKHARDERLVYRWQNAMFPFFHVFNLGTIFVFNAVFYDMYNWRDYRLFAPYIIMTVLVFIASGRNIWVVKVVIIVNILLFSFFWDEYTFIHEPNFTTQPNITELREDFNNLLHYEEGQDPWCNSLLWAASFSDTHFGLFPAIPPGIGISFITKDKYLEFPWKARYARDIALPLKSKYVVIDPYKKVLPKGVTGLRYLGDAPPYKVYVNRYAGCQ